MSETNDQWSLMEYQPPNSAERWFFRKNLTPTPSPGDTRFRYVAYLTLHFEPRDETGLPSSEDEAQLFEIENTGLPELEGSQEAVHVASVLKAGVKDLLFYTCDPDAFLRRANAFRDRHRRFPMECELIEDPSWGHYAEFP